MRILYFAWLREKTGQTEENLDLPANLATVGELIAWLKNLGPGYADAFAHENLVRCAVDHEFAGPDQPIQGAREIAFFPPVTGG